MPWSAPNHCPAGHAPYRGNRCPACRSRAKAAADQRRPSAGKRGYTSKWQKDSKAFLALPGNDRCACGCGRVANIVDHIKAAKGDMKLFWDRSNWQPMNLACNSRKAIREEGGFGQPITQGRGE